MGLTLGPVFLQQMALEHGPDAFRTSSAVADQPDSAPHKLFDCRYPDLLLQAAGNHFALVKFEIEGPAHDFGLRLTAAEAYRALE